MAEFFRQIIPVSMDIWIAFFILPAIISFVAQVILCFKTKSIIKHLIPIFVGVFIGILILIYRFIFIPIGIYAGGFIALFLVFTTFFIIGASILGWIIYFAIKGVFGRR